jgi:uncharacterized damage-inducible protein DinB
MNREILLIVEKMKEVYEGDPWFGRSAKSLLNDVNEKVVYQKPSGQHSILELLWHMITWKEFVISRLRPAADKDLRYFEKNDWRKLDHTDTTVWKKGLEQFHQLHKDLVELTWQEKDELLSKRVEERNYDFRKLLLGVIEHDIYHLGQIAYLTKMLRK